MADDVSTPETDRYLVALGENIRAFREQMGWTHDELGEQAGGIPKATISRLEAGRIPSPKLLQLLPIADALGYDLSDLLPGGSGGPRRAAEKVKLAMESVREQTAAAVREVEGAARAKLDDALKAERDQVRVLRQSLGKTRRSLEKVLSELPE